MTGRKESKTHQQAKLQAGVYGRLASNEQNNVMHFRKQNKNLTLKHSFPNLNTISKFELPVPSDGHTSPLGIDPKTKSWRIMRQIE